MDLMREVLERNGRIAVVGLSPRPDRPSHGVSAYMARRGYQITPVNPDCDAVLGVPSARSLTEASERGALGIVNVFRRPAHVPPIVEEALALGADAIWLQLGITAPSELAERARAAGVPLIENRCIAVEHRRLLAGRARSAAG